MCWACTSTINSTSPLRKQLYIPLQQFTCHTYNLNQYDFARFQIMRGPKRYATINQRGERISQGNGYIGYISHCDM